MITVEAIIQELGLEAHPCEGGYFVETYRSQESVSREELADRYESARHFSTAIYYLLTPGTYSEMHRLKSDEVFHFYLGDPVTMVQLNPDGSSNILILGNDLLEGQRPQVVVSAGVWQGSFLSDGGRFALLGATVAPGFEYADYESGKRGDLIAQYPDRAEFIRKLTNGEE